MIREIINEVREAIQEAFTCALHTNSGSFVLFLARGDYDHRLEGEQFANLDPKPSPYCLDYMLDAYKDETRDKFYIRYLNRRYKNDDFKYQGDDGIDDLCVEMMIYSHVWESEAFLKHLYRLSNNVSGKEFYDWDVSGLKFHGHPLIMETKERFKDACPKLYKIIDASYTWQDRQPMQNLISFHFREMSSTSFPALFAPSANCSARAWLLEPGRRLVDMTTTFFHAP